MNVAIINKESLKIVHKYVGDEPEQYNYGGPWGNSQTHVHVMIPEEVTYPSDTVTTSETYPNESWISEDGMTTVYEDPSDETYTYVQGDMVLEYNIVQDSELAKTAQVQALYDTMNTEVYAEMKNVFGTSNAESATAFHQTWKEMQENPNLFIFQGIVDDDGNELQTTASVAAYVATRLEAAANYALWRMKRIEQFRTDRAAILAA